MNSNTDIQNLAGNHQAGHALQRAFYCDPGIFLSDREKILDNSWHMAGHGSRIPNEGDYFLFNICGEELIIVRGKGGDIYAHYNVCRHRGSRICRENSGRKSSLVCPYHAWTYNLDGSLRRARLMGEGFSPGNHALHPCHVNVLEGIIFVALGEEPVDFEESTAAYVDYLEFHGLKNAKTARRLELPTRANWKLVVENFIECYHCTPSHPEYSAVHDELKLLAAGAGVDSGPEAANRKYKPELADWNATVMAMGHPGSCQNVSRLPIKKGFLTESQDGQPVAPLMGKFKQYDGGVTYIAFNYMNYLVAANDHAVMVCFTPLSELMTGVAATWLVDGEAREGVDYEPARVSWLWDVTLAQDAIITEDNQAGVLSSQFQPGPYSEQERMNRVFTQWYLDLMSKPTAPVEGAGSRWEHQDK